MMIVRHIIFLIHIIGILGKIIDMSTTQRILKPQPLFHLRENVFPLLVTLITFFVFVDNTFLDLSR